MEKKFTPLGAAFAKMKLEHLPHDSNFSEILMVCLSGVTSNAGWAGLNPEATAMKAVETAICFCNIMANPDIQNKIQ